MTARLTYHSRENYYSLSVSFLEDGTPSSSYPHGRRPFNGKTIGKAETEQRLIAIVTQWAKERKVALSWQ